MMKMNFAYVLIVVATLRTSMMKPISSNHRIHKENMLKMKERNPKNNNESHLLIKKLVDLHFKDLEKKKKKRIFRLIAMKLESLQKNVKDDWKEEGVKLARLLR